MRALPLVDVYSQIYRQRGLYATKQALSKYFSRNLLSTAIGCLGKIEQVATSSRDMYVANFLRKVFYNSQALIGQNHNV